MFSLCMVSISHLELLKAISTVFAIFSAFSYVLGPIFKTSKAMSGFGPSANFANLMLLRKSFAPGFNECLECTRYFCAHGLKCFAKSAIDCVGNCFTLLNFSTTNSSCTSAKDVWGLKIVINFVLRFSYCFSSHNSGELIRISLALPVIFVFKIKRCRFAGIFVKVRKSSNCSICHRWFYYFYGSFLLCIFKPCDVKKVQQAMCILFGEVMCSSFSCIQHIFRKFGCRFWFWGEQSYDFFFRSICVSWSGEYRLLSLFRFLKEDIFYIELFLKCVFLQLKHGRIM